LRHALLEHIAAEVRIDETGGDFLYGGA